MMESQSERGSETTSKSRTACILCRSRKVKCDKQLPGCERCQNLGVRCPGYSKDGESRLSIGSTETVDSIFRTAGIERRKIGACRECRNTKSKCSQTRPQCQRCRAKSLPCTYASKTSKIRHIEPAPSSSTALITDETDVMSTASASTSAPERPPEDEESSWLYSSELPALKNIRILADLYFAHVHPLRSMGFLHKPSFMRALDHNDLIPEYGEALVYAICALGARFIESDNGASTHSRTESSERIPGKQWGEQARKLVRIDSCIPSVRNLMSLVLYCEYGLRTGDNAFVFMLTGCCCRMGRLLRLDVEPSTAQKTLSPGELTKQECHRRLMWSCYILDSFVGAGVEGNLCWVEGAPKIPLPCREMEFLNQTRTTPVFLEFDKDLANPAVTDVDIRGQIVRIMYLRTQVLRCIRSHYPGNGSEPPIWDPSSRFMRLLSSIENWHQSLPGNLTFEDMNIYIQKDQQNLGALFFMHLVYNACIFDLTRITLAGYNFPLSAALSNAPAEFKALQQEKRYHHADVVSQILRSALACGIGSLDDHYTSTAAFESTKVQVIYVTTLARGDFDTYSRVVTNINTNLEILTLTHRYADMPNVYLSALCPYLVQFGFPDIAARWEPFKNTVLFPPAALAEEVDVDTPNSTEIVGPVEASYLNQIATFRLARLEVKTPERESTPREEAPAESYQQPPIVSSQQPPHYRTEPNPLQDLAAPAAHNTELPAVQIHTQPGPSGVSDFVAGQSMAPPLFTPQGTMPPFTEEHYLRMAEEISDYMTWDGYFQTWSDFPGGDYPAM